MSVDSQRETFSRKAFSIPEVLLDIIRFALADLEDDYFDSKDLQQVFRLFHLSAYSQVSKDWRGPARSLLYGDLAVQWRFTIAQKLSRTFLDQPDLLLLVRSFESHPLAFDELEMKLNVFLRMEGVEDFQTGKHPDAYWTTKSGVKDATESLVSLLERMTNLKQLKLANFTSFPELVERPSLHRSLSGVETAVFSSLDEYSARQLLSCTSGLETFSLYLYSNTRRGVDTSPLPSISTLQHLYVHSADLFAPQTIPSFARTVVQSLGSTLKSLTITFQFRTIPGTPEDLPSPFEGELSNLEYLHLEFRKGCLECMSSLISSAKRLRHVMAILAPVAFLKVLPPSVVTIEMSLATGGSSEGGPPEFTQLLAATIHSEKLRLLKVNCFQMPSQSELEEARNRGLELVWTLERIGLRDMKIDYSISRWREMERKYPLEEE